MTDRERELAWRGLVVSMPGVTHEDRVLSLMLYTARDLVPVDARVSNMTVKIDMDGRPPMSFTAKKIG